MNHADFIKSYNHLLDQMARANPTRLFWATDFASKNRISCALPDLMQKLAVKGSINPVAENQWIKGFLFRCKRIIGVFYHAFIMTMRMAQARRLRPSLDPQKTYTVLKTFIYDHSFDSQGQYKDAFFNRLPGHLQPKRNLIIYAHILGSYAACLRKIPSCGQTIIPMEALLTFKDIMRISVELLFGRLQVPGDVLFAKQNVSRIVAHEFWRTFKGIQFWQMAHFEATVNLAKSCRMDQFIMTYENYPWERMVLMALRQQSPSTKTIGYQHTVVPQAYLNYFVSDSEKAQGLLPDRVLTVGEEPARIMRLYGQYEGVDVQPACALRISLNAQPCQALEALKIRRVLLPLEGFYHVYPMVAYVLEQLGQKEGYDVRIRTHPLLPWGQFEQKYHPHVLRYGNVSISQKVPLKEDLEWADVVMYWSSTVSLEALMHGKPVIHYQMTPGLSFDPLFACDNFKWTINGQSKLTDLLFSIQTLGVEQVRLQQQGAKEYLARYFHPVNETSLNKFIF